ncbi:ubiquitin-like modifier-activating enzyme ATG7 [Sitodiplosis mosellana]|uniref:ubiquitin-like modifier-activating enzyme ATG7 n=1 Tax=Sitodiplosis mosellana TaxID=263140 RepID=UPI00244389D0|nr:ubiquitin-like modifier-activating enzyme ATG7 [Sitodiplosis mosellana]
MTEAKIFQFQPFSSFVSSTFWHKLAELKIDVDRLNDDRKPINGFYTNSDVIHCSLETDATSFNREFESRSNKYQSHGAIVNKNKIEDFKSCDKLELVKEEGKLIWEDITSGACLEKPSLLSRFFIFAFGDLKAFNYYYHFAYPCPSTPIFEKTDDSKIITDVLNPSQLEALTKVYFPLSSEQRSFFIITKNDADEFNYIKLSDKISATNKSENFADANLDEIYFCFSDPCPTVEYAGWPLRLFLVMLTHLCPNLREKTIKILSMRVKKSVSLETSVLFTIKLPPDDVDIHNVKWIGWEPNDQGKYIPRCASLANSMDPQKLAESGVYLNLKLMKWRLLPSLDLDKISKVKCLIFGAGTLGCSVARNLMAWGLQHISFLDSGHVSFSNPVRQSLFTYNDASKKKEKAKTAAARLKEIHPGIAATGYNIHIPMPGFTVGESLKKQATESLKTIEELIESHDVIFLLTDSRESRWLPTMLAAAHDKIVINAALGFDSYLVMRHGCNPSANEDAADGSTSSVIDGLKCIPGNKLGCYFCNDITAPGDSMKDRTLDQQCTVTRPAVSNIAGGLAVELLISLIQHPQRSMSPAYISINNHDVHTQIKSIPEGLLGIIPHSIRGSLSNFEHIHPATERFVQCVACSKKILDEYRNRGHEFLFQVFESSKCLEELSGISEMLNAQHEEILEFDESSDFEISE